MKNKKPNQITLMCFSLPVMAATFLIEIILAFIVLVKYKKTLIVWLIATLLATLSVFQLAEFFVCGGFGLSSSAWSRIGYVAITMLPALGIHIIQLLAGKKSFILPMLVYLTSLAWTLQFLLTSNTFIGHECAGNYVIFQLRPSVGGAYFVYYYTLLIAGILLAWQHRLHLKKNQKKQKEALMAMIVGYLVFLLPTTIINTLDPASVNAIPSIMCGFAVLLALIVYFYILPRVAKRK